MKSLKIVNRIIAIFMVLCIGTISVSAQTLDLPSEASEKEIVVGSKLETNLKYSKLALENVPKKLFEGAKLNERKEGLEVIAVDTVDAENLFTFTTENKNGSKTVYSYDTPIKYKDSDTGEIKYINNDFISSKRLINDKITDVSPDKSISFNAAERKTYAYENSSNSIKTFLPENIVDGILAKYGDYSLNMTPVTEKADIAARRNYTFLENDYDVVEYKNTFGEGAHLQYAFMNSGFKENIMLDKYAGINEFQFDINLNGLVPDCTEGKVITLLDENTKEPVFVMNPPWARDSYPNENEGDEFHLNQNLYYKISEIETGKYLLTMVVDRSYLENPEIVYPVLIDPPVVVVWASNIIDTSVFSGSNDNWYNQTHLSVGKHNLIGESLTYAKINNIWMFKYINPNNITEANFWVTQTYGGSSASYNVNLYDSNIIVSAQSATYSRLNSAIGSRVSTTSCGANGDYAFDIKHLVVQWLKNDLGEGGFHQDYGFILKAESTGKSNRQFASTRNPSSDQPQLDIFYNEDTSVTNGVYYIRNVNSSKYVDIESQSSDNGKRAHQWSFHGGASQQWKIEHVGNGFYKLTNMKTNKVLEVSNAQDANDAPIQQWSYDPNTSAQKWRIVRNADNSFRFIPQCSSFRAMDVESAGTANGSKLHLYDYFDSAPQKKWALESAVTEGSYYIKNQGTNKYLNANGSALRSTIGVSGYTGSTSQQWHVTRNTNGSYRMTPINNTSMLLDVQGYQTGGNGTIVQLFTSDGGEGGDDQKWWFVFNSDGSFRFAPSHDFEQSLDADVGTSNVAIWSYSGTSNQKWVLEPVTASKLASKKTFSAFDVGDSSQDEAGLVKTRLTGMGYMDVGTFNNANGYVSAQTIKDIGSYSDIVYINGHGDRGASLSMQSRAYQSIDDGQEKQNWMEYLSADVPMTAYFRNTLRCPNGIPQTGIGARFLSGSTTKTNSFWNKKTKWAIFAQCSQLNYGSQQLGNHWDGQSINNAQIWARTMLGDGHRMHGILGYYTAAPPAEKHMDALPKFFNSLDNGYTFVTSWFQAHDALTAKMNYAMLYNNVNYNDNIRNFTASSASGSNYVMVLQSRESATVISMPLKSNSVSTYSKAADFSQSSIMHGITLENNILRDEQKFALNNLLKSNARYTMNYSDDGSFEFQREAINQEKIKFDESTAVSMALDQLKQANLLPDNNYRISVDYLVKRTLTSSSVEFSEPEIVQYNVYLYRTFNGYDILSDRDDGVIVSIDNNGVSHIKYLWRNIIQSAEVYKIPDSQSNSSKAIYTESHSASNKMVSQAYYFKDNQLIPVLVFDDDGNYTNSQFVDLYTGKVVQ